jgi:hypothetical protein
LPTHRFWFGRPPIPSRTGGSGGGAGAAIVLLVPRPRDDRLPSAGGGGSSSSGGTGAYSRTVDGLDWGRFSDDGSTRIATRTAMPSRARGGYVRVQLLEVLGE